jgi:hypothetical protein
MILIDTPETLEIVDGGICCLSILSQLIELRNVDGTNYNSIFEKYAKPS